jgi:hypothetical protein
MKDAPGRGTNPFDPTDERASDPTPGGDDALAREKRGSGDTPRRYDDDSDEHEAALPSNDATLKTHI